MKLQRGEDRYNARLNGHLVRVMRTMHAGGSSIYRIAKYHSMPYSTVSNAVRGITWKHIKGAN